MSFSVGETSRLARVSVRTLHHYDAIGLVRPTGRTAAGYRLYSASDLRRILRVLYYRELAFGLKDIAAMLSDPTVDIDEHLRRQHHLLRLRKARTEALIAAVELEMEAQKLGISLTPEEQFELFGSDAYGASLAEEAESRWGSTDPWTQSRRRSSAYSKTDWTEIHNAFEANRSSFAELLSRGEPSDGHPAMSLAEEHRRLVSEWFYECEPQLHASLGELYTSDPRFTETFDQSAPGLARYVCDAYCANARRPAD